MLLFDFKNMTGEQPLMNTGNKIILHSYFFFIGFSTMGK
jgi:hypothetical protein